MPRLIGNKRSYFPFTLLVFMTGLIIGGGAVGEYTGLFDYIPKIGETASHQQVLTN